MDKDELQRQFGKRVAVLRHERKVAQEKFALDNDLHRTWVSKVERGIISPSLWNVYRLAKALDVTPSQLLTGIGED